MSEEQLMLFAEDSLVKTCPQQGQVKDLRENDQACGLSSVESLTKQNQSMRSSKMSQCFALEDWKQFSGHSMRSGMMHNGIVSQLPPLALRINGIESGLLPTPTCHLAKEGAYPAEFTRNTPSLSARIGGKAHPVFIEWMMGFPKGWTDLNS